MADIYGDANGVNFLVHLDDLDLNLNQSGYMLGFFGNSGPSSAIQVGEWNGTTYMVQESNETQIKAQGRNIKYANATQAYVDGITSPMAITKIPNYQSTLNIRFKNLSSVRVLVARCRFYNRIETVDDPPEGAGIKMFEIAHRGVRQVASNFTKGHSTWQEASSGEWIRLSMSPGPSGIYGGTTASYAARQHDWYLGMSLSPHIIGTRSSIGLQFSVEYL